MTARQVLAVLAPQLGQQAPALLHVDQALRVVLPALDLVAQRARQVGQLDGGGGQAARGSSSKASRPARALPARPSRSRAPPSPPRGRAAPRPRAPPRGRPPASARRSSSRRRARLLVGVLEVGGGDLLHLVAQDVGLAGPLLGVAAEAGQRLVERAQLARAWPAPG